MSVKVRIALAIDEKGNWNSCGWKAGSDKDKMELACEVLPEGGINCFWVEVEVPIPKPIKGTVTSADAPFEFPDTHP